MTQFYIYSASMLCSGCAEEVMANTAKPVDYDADNESSWDSGDYPKGPYNANLCEADSPAHCNRCGVFFENPLTDEGRAWVRDLLEQRGHDTTAPQCVHEYKKAYKHLL
ncbi:MAG: hypothetical protein DDT38_01134 [Firmicutes bacterium]|nr:hypothetical protein [candidate division NPL-UPA2 bacterium]